MNDNGIERIHETALALLEEPGIRIEHPALEALLLKAGARSGAAAEVVRFPRRLVMERIAPLPSGLPFCRSVSTAGSESVPTARRSFGPFPGMNMFEEGSLRPFTSKDMARWARLLDRLPNLDGVFSYAMDDVPPKARDVVRSPNPRGKHDEAYPRLLLFPRRIWTSWSA